MIASAPNFSNMLSATVGTLLFAGVCIGAATAPAAAAPISLNANGERTIEVSYADLDLGSPSGRAVLDRRINEAARKVCANGAPDPASATREYQCVVNSVKATRAAALAAVKSPRTAG